MNSTCIAKFVHMKNLGKFQEKYVYVRYCKFLDEYQFPYEAKARYNKVYLNVYDFIEQELEYIHKYDGENELVTGLKYKSL